jgi:uncharacterized protein (TIGR03067 family)
MFARAILPFSALLLIGAGDPTPEAKKELEKLQGEWKVVSMEIKGKKSEGEALKGLQPLVVKGSEWFAPLGGVKSTFKIDPTKSPKELDLQRELKGKEVTFRGIYKIEGDTLTFCRALAPTGERPTEFKAGEEVVLLQFKRSAPGDDKKEPPQKKSADPISVRLVAKKATYLLDRQGMTAEKYREAIKEGKIAAPAIDLVLEITNTMKEDIDITVVGISPRLTLDLKGKDGIEKRTIKRPHNKTVRIILKPGQSHSLPVTRLAGYSDTGFGDQAFDDQIFWTEPGEYTLAASFETNIRQPPIDGKSGPFISKMKAYSAAPIKLSVSLK